MASARHGRRGGAKERVGRWSHFGEAFAEQTMLEPGRYSFSALVGTSLVEPNVIITDHSGMGSGAGSVNFTFTVVP